MIARGEPDDGAPTIFHVTHFKAGSTWIDAILRRAAPERTVEVKPRVGHFRDAPLEPGMIYPRVYVARGEFERASLPKGSKRFVVIRDIRDTMVSAYFSLKFSHPLDQFPQIEPFRQRLRGESFKEGLLLTMQHPAVAAATQIQQSWVSSGATLIRYEDLLRNDAEILERVLIDECGLDVDRGRLRAAVDRSRFGAMSGGRLPGEEDHTAHQRKGVPGDWRDYVLGEFKDAVKRDWGDLLIATGYERDLDW